jgi:transcriptional regulator with XRE-family HTH domain
MSTEQPTVLRSPPDIGRLARARRKSLGLTIHQFSDLSGLSLGFIVDMEKGKPTAAVGKVMHALAILGIDLTAAPR